jgi:putative spermidine/putrescine transport system substrate-binding protein
MRKNFDMPSPRAAANLRPSRRSVLRGGAALAGATAAFGWMPAVRAQSTSISVTCWGGAYENAIRDAFAVPFTEETGIEVVLVNNADLARMKVQVESGNVAWDVFDSVGPQIMAGSTAGLWESLDLSLIDPPELIVEPAADHVGTYFFAGGIGFDPQRFPEGKHPKTFADFWNVEQFPGRRGLRTRVSETLEMALLADGVPPDQLYPLDVERGFAALDRIKPHVRKWIEAKPETVSLISSGELDFTYTYLSRVLPARRDGTSVDMSMAQTLNSLEYLAVPRGGNNTKAAMQYVGFCLRPDRQAAFCELVSFSPNAVAALELATEETRSLMPNMSDPNSVVVNDQWWGENYEVLQERFTEWMLL